MNASKLFRSSRRRLIVLVAAAILALAAAYAPVLTDNLAGTGLVTTTYACQGAGGACP